MSGSPNGESGDQDPNGVSARRRFAVSVEGSCGTFRSSGRWQDDSASLRFLISVRRSFKRSSRLTSPFTACRPPPSSYRADSLRYPLANQVVGYALDPAADRHRRRHFFLPSALPTPRMSSALLAGVSVMLGHGAFAEAWSPVPTPGTARQASLVPPFWDDLERLRVDHDH